MDIYKDPLGARAPQVCASASAAIRKSDALDLMPRSASECRRAATGVAGRKAMANHRVIPSGYCRK